MAAFLLRVLRRLTDADLAESIVGDLVEERHRLARRSSFAAAVWFVREAASLCSHAALHRLRESLNRFVRTALFVLRSQGEFGRIVRSMARSPWYTTTIVAVVALTMMMATTTFAIVDGVLFKSLPYHDADRLYEVSAGYSDELRARTGTRVTNRWGLGLSLRDMRDLAAAVPGTAFTAIDGGASSAALGDLREWTPVIARADRHFFDVTGLRPFLGGLAPADFEPSTVDETPVLISQGLWQAQFDRRMDVIGRTLQVRTQAGPVTYRVRGVLPSNFLFPSRGLPNLLAPLVIPLDSREDRSARNYHFLARLPAGVHFERAQATFNEVARAVRADLPDRHENGGAGPADVAALRPLDGVLRDFVRPAFLSVFAAALALVFLGSLSVSGLIVGRVSDRVREFSVRRALGADRGQIAATVALEVGCITALGGALGLMLTPGALQTVVRLMPANAGLLKVPALDWRVLGFTGACLAASIVVTSLWPIRQSMRLSDALRSGRSRRAAGRTMVVGLQVALGLVLTVGGTLFVGSLIRVWQRDIGLDLAGVTTIDGQLSRSLPPASRRLALNQFLDEIRALPGVVSAGATSAPLMRRGTPGGEFYGDTYPVTRGFLDAWKLRLLSGRMPTSDELDSAAPVVLISEGVARRYFGTTPPLGQHLTAADRSYLVIGLVADAQNGAWDSRGGFGGQIYRPSTSEQPYFTAVIRGAAATRSLVDAVLAAPSVTAGSVLLQRAASADALLSATITERRLRAWLYGAFAVGALSILGAGLLGMVAMDVVGRTREIGVRYALGARAVHVIAMLLREQVTAVTCGAAGGALIAWWGVRLVQADLYQVSGDGT